MAATATKTRNNRTTSAATTRSKRGKKDLDLTAVSKNKNNDVGATAAKLPHAAALADDHLPPLLLTFLVVFCSGALLIFSLRDFLSTGRNIGGTWDEAMLVRRGAGGC
jgi:hypothetical protein